MIWLPNLAQYRWELSLHGMLFQLEALTVSLLKQMEASGFLEQVALVS